MDLLYFFNQGCPQVLQEKFEAVPSANGAARPIFPISPFSQFTASRGKIGLCTFYTFFLGGVPRYCRRNLRPFRPQTAPLCRFFRFSPFSQFTASIGKIRLCTFYTFFLGGGIGFYTKFLSPFQHLKWLRYQTFQCLVTQPRSNTSGP